MKSNLEFAILLQDIGWLVFPCKGDKRPYTQHGKDDATTDQAIIRGWWGRWPDALIGIYCERSGFFAVDLDVKNGANGLETWEAWTKEHGQPPALSQSTPSGGWHILFELPQDLRIPNNANKLAPGVDLRSNGYICTGGPYRWTCSPLDYKLPPAPDWLLAKIRQMGERKKPTTTTTQPTMGERNDQAGDYWLDHYLGIAAQGNRNENGFNLATQLRDSGLSEGEAEGIMLAYCARVPGSDYTEAEALASMRSAYSQPRREPAKLPSLSAPVSRNGHKLQPPEDPADELDTIQAKPSPGDLTDAGNADRLVKQYGDRMRWAADWGWLMWDKRRWLRDKNGLVMRFAKKTARNIYQEAAEASDDERAKRLARWATASLSNSLLKAMLEQAKSELPASPDDFDADPWALNLQNGVLDLRTGKLYAHDPGRLITKIAGTHYDPTAQCPTWDAFLERVLVDQDVIYFMRRAIGYTLTGSVGEQVLFFLHGSGANGKSTFIRAILDMLGDYGKQAAPQMLMYGDRHPTEIADLHGARFVATIEVEEGRRLAEVLVKQLTGGDRITARFMRRDFFSFDPTHKIWLAANHKPVIKGTDYAIWRRIRLVPFDVVIPPAEQDSSLGDKLRAELPGILAWAVRGCLEWQKIGLAAPEKILQAIETFRMEMDLMAGFLDERCIVNSLASVTAGALYADYKAWAEESGEKPISQRAFSARLKERGYTTSGRDGSGRALYSGLGLLAKDAENG